MPITSFSKKIITEDFYGDPVVRTQTLLLEPEKESNIVIITRKLWQDFYYAKQRMIERMKELGFYPVDDKDRHTYNHIAYSEKLEFQKL